MNIIRYMVNLIIATDAGLLRFQNAFRILLSTLVTALILSLLAIKLGIPAPLSMYGVMIAMMSSAAVNDDTLKAQKITFLLIPILCSAALILGVIISHLEWLNISVFLILIFAAVYIRRFGPRGAAFGILIFNTYFFVLFIHASAVLLPFLLISTIAGIIVSYIIRFYAVPESPYRILKFMLWGFSAQVWLIVYQSARYIRKPGTDEKFKFRTRKHQERLNDISILMEDKLNITGQTENPLVQNWINELTDVEIIVETVVHSAWHLKASGLLSANDSKKLALLLNDFSLEQKNSVYNSEVITSYINDLCERTPDEFFRLNLNRFKWALEKIHEVHDLNLPFEFIAISKNNEDLKEETQNQPAADITNDIKQSIKSVVAAGLSIFAGKMISPNRWYWAVITSYILFTTTETVGETIKKTWQRVSGTAVGIIIGIGIAELITMNPKLELAVIFLLIFLSFYFIQVSYTSMIIFFTTLLAFLYKLLGQFTSSIMVIRLEETLTGGIIGALVAIFLFPHKTRSKINNAMIDVMNMIAELMEKRSQDKTLHGSREMLLGELKNIERELQKVRSANLNTRIHILPFVTLNRNITGHSISVLVFAFKHYLITATQRESEPAFRNGVNDIEELLVKNIRSAVDYMQGNKSGAIIPADDKLDELFADPNDKHFARKLLKIQWLELMNTHINTIASEN